MSKIQQLRNVAGEADTLCQALAEFFHDYFQSFAEDETDENAEALRDQVSALGQNAREAWAHVPATPSLFPVGSEVCHVKSAEVYRILQNPDSGLRLEGTDEPAYEYGIDDGDAARWVRCQSEMEDGRFVTPPKIPVEASSRRQEANGWVEAGMWHTAMFAHPLPAGVKGCPCGRSQVSVVRAIRDLLDRANAVSGTCFGASHVVMVKFDSGDARWRREGEGWRCHNCETVIAAAWPFRCECPKPIPAT